jgi:hypothetical protein
VETETVDELLEELRSVKDTIGCLADRVTSLETAIGGAGAVLREVGRPTSSCEGAAVRSA